MNNSCGVCKLEGKFSFKNVCVENCPIGYAPDFNSVCKICVQLNMYTLEDNCVNKCPKDFKIDNSKVCYKDPPLQVVQSACVPNPCKNEGHCIESSDKNSIVKINCICSLYYSGNYCEIKNQFIMTTLNELLNIDKNSDTILNDNAIQEISQMLKNEGVLMSISPEMSKKIYDFTDNQLKLAIDGKIPANPYLLKLVDATLSVQIKQVDFKNNSTISKEMKSEYQEKLNSMKKSVGSFVDNVMKNFKGNEPMTIGSSMLTVHKVRPPILSRWGT